ncbi:AfsR/SARP family transcriptional regulator [Phytohabitans suffuscus]|uniref:AfsR/SARP family transcriptional regulator n=1 Tax=Phytohabitans suffuscus TaxID=624315 RepID=UPI001563BCA2|nr:BTAD domain-containing putative transcriptional regulator [Phytohabitans suffuscus]
MEVWRDDHQVPLVRKQQRLIVGILALELDRVVSTDALVEHLWGEQAPERARAVLQSRISELRSKLGARDGSSADVVLAGRGDGYRLTAPASQVDAELFRQIVSGGAGRPDEAVRESLRHALSLWRGPVLGNELETPAATSLIHRLEAERLAAYEALFEAELRLGLHQRIADEILDLAGHHPTRERLVEQAMTALRAVGRSSEALRLYEQCRRILDDDLGTSPTSALRELHLAILRDDRDTASPPENAQPGTPPAAPAAPPSPEYTPQNLPPDIAYFTGRETAMAALADGLLGGHGNAPPVVVVIGPAGVGKTALSVRAAHALSQRFPDGQLFANLHGFDTERPVDPTEVLGRFLRLLGVTGSAVPATLDERVDLYRSLLSRRRVIVVLDNASVGEQVMPLIPAGPDCAVIVNGRNPIAAVMAARTIRLNVMEAAEAKQLLRATAGDGRVSAEADSAVKLVRRCGGLPLAIRIAAALLVAKPHWTVAKLVERLDDEQTRLDRFSYGDLDVRGSIGLSYRGLSRDAQRLINHFGDLEVPDIPVWLGAALLDTGLDTAEEAFEELIDAQLFDHASNGITGPRFKMHNLVRLVAREHCQAAETTRARWEARARARGAYLSLAEVAFRAVHGSDLLRVSSEADRWPVADEVRTAARTDPLGWFEQERVNVEQMVQLAAAEGTSADCWDLACAFSPLYPMRHHADGWEHLLAKALERTRRAGDIRGQAAVLCRTAELDGYRHEYDSSLKHLLHSAALFERAGDRYGRATATALAGSTARMLGRLGDAARRFASALPDLVEGGDFGGAAYTLRNMAQLALQEGDLAEADALFDQALAFCHRVPEARRSLAQVLFWQGMLRIDQERYPEAEAAFAEVRAMTTALGDLPGQAQAVRGLGLLRQRQGHYGEARRLLHQALEMARQPYASIIEISIKREVALLNTASGHHARRDGAGSAAGG